MALIKLKQLDTILTGSLQVSGSAGVTGSLSVTSNIEASGNISGSVTSTGSFGYLNVDGDTVIGGNLTFGDAASDSVTFGADIASNVIPDASDSYNLGSDSQRWNDLYLSGSISASGGNHSITSDDTIDIDADGALTIDGGSIAIGTDANVAVDFNSSTFDLDSSGAITVDGLSTLSVDVDGATNINTSAGNITVDSEAGSLVLDGHTGVDIDASDSGKVAIDGAGGIDIGVNADVAIDVDASTFDLDASSTVHLSGSSVTLDGGSTGISILGNASEVDITTTGTVDINSAALDIDASAGLTMTSTTMAFNPSGIFDLDAAGAITIDGASITLGGDADTAFDIDTSTLDIDSSGAVTIDGATSLSVIGSGSATFGDDTEHLVYDGSGNVDFDSVALDIDSSGAITIDGTSTVSIDGADDMNIVGVLVTLSYDEDETTSPNLPGGCGGLAGGQPAADTISGTIMHGQYNASANGNNDDAPASHTVESLWYNDSMNGEIVFLSESEIIAEIDADGAGLGAYSLEITVDAEAGNTPGPTCSRSDDGEEVSYKIELIVYDYSIAPFFDIGDIE